VENKILLGDGVIIPQKRLQLEVEDQAIKAMRALGCDTVKTR
jgi:hypothetical protein